MKNFLSALAAVSLMTVAAHATTLTLSSPGVVGIVEPGSPADPGHEAGYVNHLLSLGPNISGNVFDAHVYATSATDYNGSVSDADSATDITKDTHNYTIPAGWEFALAKFGDNAIVISLNFLSYQLPEKAGEGLFSPTITGNPRNPNITPAKDLGLSHFVVFNHREEVPDGGATVALLGVGLLGLGAMRRKLS